MTFLLLSICEKKCYRYFRVSKQNLSRQLCHAAAEKNGFRGKYPSRCGADGQNMFLDTGHKFPGLLVAAHCALSPHLEHDLTEREKKGKKDGLCVCACVRAWMCVRKNTLYSSTEQTNSISLWLHSTHISKQERDQGKGSVTCSQS